MYTMDKPGKRKISLEHGVCIYCYKMQVNNASGFLGAIKNNKYSTAKGRAPD